MSLPLTLNDMMHQATRAFNLISPKSFNKESLGNFLRCLVGANLRNWDLIIPTTKFVYSNSVNRPIGMSPFEVVHGYKAKKHIDLIPVMHHLRVFEFASAFASCVHDLHKEISKKIQVVHIINPMIICIVDILNLMRVIP